MNLIEKKLNRNYLFDCIKYKNEYSIYLMPLAEWILNHYKYAPSYNPDEWEYVFRGNILNVTEDNVKDFIRAVEVDKIVFSIDGDNLQGVLSKRELPFYFFIDLDNKNYVSCFYDIEVESYLPDETWVGIYDDPIKYLPDNIASIFIRKKK
jgi:hypothetical protein